MAVATPGAPESAVARAVLIPKPETGALTEVQKKAEKIKKIRKEKSPRSATEGLRARKPIDRKRNEGLLDRNISAQVDSTTGKRSRLITSEEGKRFSEAERWNNLAQDLLEKGYDNLTDPQQKRDVRDFVERVIENWPDGKALTNTANKDAVLEEILRDPSCIIEIRALHERVMDPSKAIVDTVADKESVFNAAKGKEDGIRKRLQEVENKENEINKNIERINQGDGVQPETSLQFLQGIKPGLESNREVAVDRGRELQYQLDDLQAERNGITNGKKGGDLNDVDKRLAQARREIGANQKLIVGIDKQLAAIRILEGQRNNLEQQLETLGQKKDELNEQLDPIQRERLAAQADLESTKALRLEAEQQFIDDLRNVFPEAVAIYLDKRIEEAEGIEKELIDKEKEATGDKAEKILLDDTKDRWEDEVWKGRGKNKKKVRVPNKEKIKDDFEHLVTAGPEGEKGLIYKMLKDRGMNEDEIKEKINDKEFMAKMTPKVAERLITMKVRTGTLREEEVTKIVESEWGGIEMIVKAIENNKAAKEAIEKLKAQGILEENWWLKKSSGSILKLLLLLFGSVATIGVLPAGMAITDWAHSELNK